MPKQIILRESIVEAGLEMTRELGFESVNARAVAKHMGCSVQPIYSYFAGMEELKAAIIERGMQFYSSFIYNRVDKEKCLESMGMANVAFAKDETNLFKLLFFRQLNEIKSFDDIYDWMGDRNAAKELAEKLHLSQDKIKEIYIMMIIFIHGIATMLATTNANIADDEIFKVVEKAYNAFILIQKI